MYKRLALLLLMVGMASAQVGRAPGVTGGKSGNSGTGSFTTLTGKTTNNVVSADVFAGANCAAKITAADSFLSTNFGTITVSNACGLDLSSAAFTLSSGHNLHFTQATASGLVYYMHQLNTLSGNNEVWGDVGVTLQLAGGSTDALFQGTGSNLSVHDIKIDGNQSGNAGSCSSTFACGHGIGIYGNASTAPDLVHIYNVTFQNFKGIPIFWHANGGGPAPTNISIDHNTFSTCYRWCIASYDASHGYHVTDNKFFGWDYEGLNNYEDAVYLYQNATPSTYSDVVFDRNYFFNGASHDKFAVEFVVLDAGAPNGLQPVGVGIHDNINDCNGASGGCGFSGVMDHADITGNTVRNCTAGTANGGLWRCGFEITGKHIVIANNNAPTGAIYLCDLNQVESCDNISVTGNHINSIADQSKGNAASAFTVLGTAKGLSHDITATGNTFGTVGALGPCKNVIIGSTNGGVAHLRLTDNLVYTDDASCTGIAVTPKTGTSSTAIDILHNTVYGGTGGYSDGGNDTTELTVARNDFSNNTTPVSKTGTGTGYRFFENITQVGQTTVGSSNILNVQHSSSPLTGNSADQAMFTYTMPANTLAAGKCARIRLTTKHNQAVNTVSYKINFGATATYTWSTSDNKVFVWGGMVCGVDATHQSILPDLAYGVNGTSVIGISTASPAETLTGSIIVNATFNVANTDTVTPSDWVVELVQ